MANTRRGQGAHERLYMTVPLVPAIQGQTTGRLRFDVTPLPAWGQTPPPPSRSAPFQAPHGLSFCQREIARIEATLQADREAQSHPQPYKPTQAIIIDDTPASRRRSTQPPAPGQSDRFLYDWASCTSWPILYAPNPPTLGPDGRPTSTTVIQALNALPRNNPAGCGGMPGAFQGGISAYAPVEQEEQESAPTLEREEDLNPDLAENPDFLAPLTTGSGGALEHGEDDDPSPFTYITGPPIRFLLPPRMNPASLWRQGARAPPRPQQRRQPKPLSPAQLRTLASAYTAHLERADEELRSRMAVLGMGDIGADVGEDPSSGSLLGCAICLEPYASEEDKPSWLGNEVEGQHVVAVGCAGFHTLHRNCLRDWLGALQPLNWTCPFCRDPLPPPAQTLAKLKDQSQESATQGDEPVSDEGMGFRNSLRAEVHRRERLRGLRCDAPACLPRYPVPPVSVATQGETTIYPEAHSEQKETGDVPPEEEALDDLTTLSPCKHEIHTDCLRTSLRVEDPVAAAALEESVARKAKLESEEDGEDLPMGHWVSCPACRHEAWVKLV